MATFKELNAKIEMLETTIALLQPAAQISVAAQACAQWAEQRLAAQHWVTQVLCAHINALVESAQACVCHFEALSAALAEGHLLRARKERQRLAKSWKTLWTTLNAPLPLVKIPLRTKVLVFVFLMADGPTVIDKPTGPRQEHTFFYNKTRNL